jgi:hypothetical protein
MTTETDMVNDCAEVKLAPLLPRVGAEYKQAIERFDETKLINIFCMTKVWRLIK